MANGNAFRAGDAIPHLQNARTSELEITNMPSIPTCICPDCGAIDPEREYYEPLWARDPDTGAWETAGYRCAECRQVSEADDWDRMVSDICSECGEIGDHDCPGDRDLWAGDQVSEVPAIPRVGPAVERITREQVA
jgi:hypothetical protein